MIKLNNLLSTTISAMELKKKKNVRTTNFILIRF